MPFSDLQNFKVLAEKLNFTNAAKALFMSQPALSKSISRLEDHLGFSLFDRSTREVELTPAGQSFYKDTVELLDLYDQAVRRARAQSERSSALLKVGGHFANPRIYAAHDAARSRLVSENAPFEIATNARHVGSIERKPGLEDPLDDALAGVDDVNLLYRSSEIDASPLETVPLFREPLAIFVPRGSDLADRGSVGLADLADHCVIRTTTYRTFACGVEDILDGKGIETRTRTRVVDSMGDLMQPRSNSEVFILTKSMVHLVPATAEASFARLECSDEDAFIDVVAAYLPEKRTPQVDRYLETVQNVTAGW